MKEIILKSLLTPGWLIPTAIYIIGMLIAFIIARQAKRRHHAEVADLERTLEEVRKQRDEWIKGYVKRKIQCEESDNQVTALTARNHVLEGQVKSLRDELNRTELRKVALNLAIQREKDGATTYMDAGLYYKFLTGRAVAPADDQPVPISPAHQRV